MVTGDRKINDYAERPSVSTAVRAAAEAEADRRRSAGLMVPSDHHLPVTCHF